MSTRCNVIIKDQHNAQYFYRHSDGYPEGVAETLGQFMLLLKSGKIRNNVSQAAGWLIVIGAAEYDYHRDYKNQETYGKPKHTPLNKFVEEPADWKVGAYEPCSGITGWIEYLYEIDLEAQTLTGWEYDDKTGKGGRVKVLESVASAA